MKNILIIGATGQIGSELTVAFRNIYGTDHVVAGYIVKDGAEELLASGPSEYVDACNRQQIADVSNKYKIDTIVNLAAVLSATGEKNPQRAWDINMGALMNVLEVARELKMLQVYTPSSMAAFGPDTPKINTPQDTYLCPTTMYGVTKVAGELLGDYYVYKYGLDVRGIRYPGIISNKTLPGGGTTDYAVQIYYDAVKYGKYDCFVNAETMLPMMYMPDCLKCTLDLMHADFTKLKHHSGFNVAAMSFTAKELADNIKKYLPNFECTYSPDSRQAIADSWPKSIDDSDARAEWGWSPDYDMDTMTQDMIKVITEKHKLGLI